MLAAINAHASCFLRLLTSAPNQIAALSLFAAIAAGCDRRSSAPPPREVVVYCSADAPVAQPVFDAFEQQTGIRVKAVFDTEATKTTGLVNRLLAEHDAGRRVCDAWWSSEPYGTIRLSRAGALATYERAGPPWPGARAKDGTWYGFVRRLRVIAFNTKFVDPKPSFSGWMNLADRRWRGRVGMARPQFGTTRGHMAVMHAIDDGKTLRAWLEALVANDVRLYDGNASVAKAVASGELYIGLTDSDDAINGMRSGWPLGLIPVNDRGLPARGADAASDQRLNVEGMQIPNTTALVLGGPNPESGRALVEFLLSDQAADLLGRGEACALRLGPTDLPELAAGAGLVNRPKPAPVTLWPERVDFEAYADHVEPAMKLCDEILGNR